MGHGAGILLGLFPDMLGQHFGLLGYRRGLQRIQRIRFLFWRVAACSANWFSIRLFGLSPVRGGQLPPPSPPVPSAAAATA